MQAGDHIFMLLAKMSGQYDKANELKRIIKEDLSKAFNEETAKNKKNCEKISFEEELEKQRALEDLRQLSNPVAYSPELVLKNSLYAANINSKFFN